MVVAIHSQRRHVMVIHVRMNVQNDHNNTANHSAGSYGMLKSHAYTRARVTVENVHVTPKEQNTHATTIKRQNTSKRDEETCSSLYIPPRWW